jgi:hypothetical protein
MKNKIKMHRLIAMKDKNQLAKSLYDTLLGEIQLKESRGEMQTDDSITKIVFKMIESCELMAKHGNSNALVEVELCKALLPPMMSKADIIAVINADSEFVAKVINAENRMKLMGELKAMLAKSGKQYNGKDASEALKEI